MKKLFVPFIAMLFLLQGCIGDDIIFDSIKADLRFNNPIDTLAIGESYQLEVTFLNELGQATSTELSWASSAPTVIEVDETGRITGLSEGSAVISS
ncbi:MAG: Ig-like domain-containing protein, partial [Phaeodactylibacter sp.]|nr:Ig-like domain-containing protein [Phaeodactylibacter sp.]